MSEKALSCINKWEDCITPCDKLCTDKWRQKLIQRVNNHSKRKCFRGTTEDKKWVTTKKPRWWCQKQIKYICLITELKYTLCLYQIKGYILLWETFFSVLKDDYDNQGPLTCGCSTEWHGEFHKTTCNITTKYIIWGYQGQKMNPLATFNLSI